jgi:hypothetical protein
VTPIASIHSGLFVALLALTAPGLAAADPGQPGSPLVTAQAPLGPPLGKGPNPSDPNRQPWLKVHLPEMDADGDHVLARAELEAEIAKTYAGYDPGNSGRIVIADLAGPARVRSALAGFVRDHAGEIDQNGNGEITKDELSRTMLGMFERADVNGDGRIELAEFDTPRGPRR